LYRERDEHPTTTLSLAEGLPTIDVGCRAAREQDDPPGSLGGLDEVREERAEGRQG